MARRASIPLLFLFIGSVSGVFLRWQFISPTPGVNYSFVLHGHSHTMFLGWIFNALYLGFIKSHIPQPERRPYYIMFYILQLLTTGMLISFPLQGYGVISIIFSTLHTLMAIVFVAMFFRSTRNIHTTSVWYAKIALLFFTFSSVGPFFLGYLMANGMGQSPWYYFSIYFYLHFQYNGFFLFGVFSLVMGLVERKNLQSIDTGAKRPGYIFAATCMPAYLLSVLWVKPGLTYNVVAGAAALTQLAGVYFLVKYVVRNRKEFHVGFSKPSRFLFLFSISALVLKIILQIFSAFPVVAQFAYELRPVVIAYLHLVLIGVISVGLFAWYVEFNLLNMTVAVKSMILFLISFVGMEACLVLTPWWSKVFGVTSCSSTYCTFIFSLVLSLSCLGIYLSSIMRNVTKISFRADGSH